MTEPPAEALVVLLAQVMQLRGKSEPALEITVQEQARYQHSPEDILAKHYLYQQASLALTRISCLPRLQCLIITQDKVPLTLEHRKVFLQNKVQTNML